MYISKSEQTASLYKNSFEPIFKTLARAITLNFNYLMIVTNFLLLKIYLSKYTLRWSFNNKLIMFVTQSYNYKIY